MSKVVIYYSFGGVTKRIVEYSGITSQVVLTPERPYTDADVLAVNPRARVNVEQADKTLRPKIKDLDTVKANFIHGKVKDFGADTDIFLGFPLWNLLPPRIILTFLDSMKELFKNHTINVFCTSGGSPVNSIERELKTLYPDLKWGKFVQFSFTSRPDDVRRWVEK